MTSSFPPGQGFVVVTHIYPQQGAQASTQAQNVMLPQTGAVSTSCSQLGKFLKGQPAALGTIQIMIGVVVFMFGIVTSIYGMSMSVYSGIMFWGAIIYITAGSLTVRAGKDLSPCLVKASMGMNIISTITAGVAVIMHILDLAVRWYPYFPCYGSYFDCREAEYIYWNRIYGTAGVMLVLSVLEFIVSICVSAFACKATCSSGTGVIYEARPSFPTGHLTTYPVNISEVIYEAPPSFPPAHVTTSQVNTYEMPGSQSSLLPPAQQSSAPGLKADRPEHLPPVYRL